MQNSALVNIGAVSLLSLMLVACKSTDDVVQTSDDMSAREATPVATTGPDDGLTAAQRAERDNALATKVFYFEFDKSDLSAEARAALVFHANQLKANPSMKYRLEGHADERGTREYNLALGERRAQAIERYLQVQGVSSSQLETISYGEERPDDTGNNEASYSKNRRVEIK
jgi:peptidoglycan-associated lipoprotein